MVAVNNIVGLAITTASIGWAALSGVAVIEDYFSLPPIEGVGYYDQTVRPGETINVKWVITKRTPCNGVSSRVWEGQDSFSMVEASRPTVIPVGTNMIRYVSTVVPAGTPAGEVKLKVQGYYKCGNAKHAEKWFMLGPVVMVVVKNETPE
jgi:hypothetical protein